jgi:hypothetical protein
MIEFDAVIKRTSSVKVHVEAPEGVRFFWLFGVPYVVTSPPGYRPADLATLEEAAAGGLIRLHGGQPAQLGYVDRSGKFIPVQLPAL